MNALVPTGVESGCVGIESVMVLVFDIVATDPQITYYSFNVCICICDRDGGGGIHKKVTGIQFYLLFY
jgi:hypothetical protein